VVRTLRAHVMDDVRSNGKELGCRWRERAWIELGVFS
jgi:hypothetical protein